MICVDGYVSGQPQKVQVCYIDDQGHQLREDAALAYAKMAAAASRDGVKLQVNSAFRTMEHQTRLYARYEAAVKQWLASGADPKKEPAPVAKPGYSHHQSGIDVDIQPHEWLDAHAAEYGFKRVVWNERWHYEFVGLPPENVA